MPLDDIFQSKNARFWSGLLIQGVVVAVVIIGVSWLFYAVTRSLRTEPPIEVKSLDPIDLGQLCSGDWLTMRNKVTVKEASVLVYYISVMDLNEVFNYPGTQVILSGFQHPKPSTFEQVFLWEVPPLEDGKYLRSFAARGTDGTEKAVFVRAYFSIEGERCNE